MTSQSNMTLGPNEQSHANDLNYIKDVCGELSEEKINLLISEMKIQYGELTWLTFNHLKKKDRIRKYVKENAIEFLDLTPEYLEDLKEQGIPLDAVLNLD